MQGKDKLCEHRLSVNTRSSSNNLEPLLRGPGRLTARTAFARVMNSLLSACRASQRHGAATTSARDNRGLRQVETLGPTPAAPAQPPESDLRSQ